MMMIAVVATIMITKMIMIIIKTLIETAAKRSVFSSQWKVNRDGALWTDAESSFHVLAAATGNVRSQRVDPRVEGTTRDIVMEDCR